MNLSLSGLINRSIRGTVTNEECKQWCLNQLINYRVNAIWLVLSTLACLFVLMFLPKVWDNYKLGSERLFNYVYDIILISTMIFLGIFIVVNT
jgi:hypothetical protein